MPWCGSCDRYHAPSALAADRTCPVCGGPVDDGGSGDGADEKIAKAPAHTRIPWHFWVLIVAISIYLGWRLIQGLIALAGLF
ncbi:MAG: hypothetical protein RIE08_02465 [Acidimicrobiales bacterium]